MALIIEDGTNVSGANSYVTVDEVRAFATLRGITSLPANDGDVEPLVIKAMDYVEKHRNLFRGRKSNSDQPLQWPRRRVYVDQIYVDSDSIPQDLKNATCQLAIDAVSEDLDPNGDGQEIVREKVGPIETEFAKTGSSTTRPQLNRADNFLKPLLKNSGRTYVTRA